MSQIVNIDAQPGDVIVTADLNAKFTDMTTATTTATGLDGQNIAEEGVDALQFPVNAADGVNDIILRGWQLADNGVGFTGGTLYNASAGGGPIQPITHGTTNPRLVWLGGQTLEDGDLLRVHFSIFGGDVNMAPPAMANHGAQVNDSSCWVVWLQWDITSAALTHWVPVPNQLDFDVALSENQLSSCKATMVVPCQQVYNDPDDVTVNVIRMAQSQHHRMYCYLNETNAQIKVYGLRMCVAGVYHFKNDAGTGNRNALTANAAWAADQIDIANVRIGAVVMAGS